MTDAQTPPDRRPELYDERVEARYRERKPRAPRPAYSANPWMIALTVLWAVLLVISTSCAIASGSSVDSFDGPSLDRHVLSAVAGNVLLTAIVVAAIQLAVLATRWRPKP
jgi:hypothetical protein